MPRNGSGTYTLPAGQPVVTLTSVSSTVFNTLTTDLANALTTSVATDGQTPMAANLPMGGYKVTNVGTATTSSDATRYDQVLLLSGANTMAANMNLGSFRITSLAKGTATTDAARVDQAVCLPGSTNLRGAPNSSTPLTKYDLSADYVVLKDSSNRSIAFSSTGTKTCDFGAAGSAINSRDQAGAFSANSWVYIYWISDGTSINTLASLSASAPTLPGTYTYFCLATALRWNGSSNIVPAKTCGNRIIYSPLIAALSAGTATVETSVTITAIVPPMAATFFGGFLSLITSTAGGSASSTVALRATTGVNDVSLVSFAQVASATGRNDSFYELNNISNTLYYINTNSANTSSAQTTINVTGYSLPNAAT